MTTRTVPARAAGVALALTIAVVSPLWAQTQIEGLDDEVNVALDSFNVPTIYAQTEHDAIVMQGYLHARDRFFQMDLLRRTFAGKAAELVGTAALPQDVQLRTLGLSRAAQASVAVQTPEVNAWLEAYAVGVNSWLNDLNNPLPPEYAALEIDRGGIPQWTAFDSLVMAKGLAFNLSFNLADIDRTVAFLTMNAAGGALGFSGIALFYSDVYRAAPFDPTVSIPTAKSGPWAGKPAKDGVPAYLNDGTLRLLLAYKEKIKDIPIMQQALIPQVEQKGSNWFVANGSLTESGFPLLANDPHLALDTPATFSESHMVAADTGMNVTGVSFPGVPGIVQGCNETICWGSTVNAIDVTDVYQEVVVAIPTEGLPPGTPTHTIFQGAPEPMQIIPQTFGANIFPNGGQNTIAPDVGVPADQGGITWVVPRRNFGPILQFDFSDPDFTTAFSAAFVGWGPTQELECFHRFARAASMDDFKAALQFFDHGSQNWSYADVNGNIAYYTSGELPIREDFQLFQGPDGLQPPLLIRDGTNTLRHEWLSVQNPQPNQVLNREILPFDEMPQIENPASGYILNANNDPIGTTTDNVSFNQLRPGGGILYLSPLYSSGMRQGRLQRLFDEALANGDKFTPALFKEYQGNNQMLDAEVLVPYILAAFANAGDAGAPPLLQGLAADPGIQEAVGRLAAWDFSTPTGIQAGYDPGDNPFALPEPTQAEIDASVAATIYSVWRGQAVQAVIDNTLAPRGMGGVLPGSAQAMSALRNLLDLFPTRQGVGISGLNFFFVPGVDDPAAARDILLLSSLGNALGLLASDDFAPAFGNSTDQNDYRWGNLHRIVLDSFLGAPLSIPGPFDPFSDVSDQLIGVARAGGLNVLDASSHSARADGLNEFMFGSGPNRRFVGTMAPGCPVGEEVIPGGVSGIPGNPNTWDQLFLWLTNNYKPLPICADQVAATTVAEEMFSPEPPLLVVLESFTAEITSEGVRVAWTTSSEVQTAGFRILRASGPREKSTIDLTPTPIAAKGQEAVGASYEFLDKTASRGDTLVYYLVEIDDFGRTMQHGPAIAQPRRSGGVRLAEGR